MSVRLAPTVDVAVNGTAYTVAVEGADVMLDEGWSPFGQVTIQAPVPSQAVLAALDPRTNPRVTVTMRQAGAAAQARALNVGVRTRAVDFVDGTLTLELATDEAQLQDRGHTGTAPDESGRAYEANLRALVNWVLAKLPDAPHLEADAGATADLTIYADATNLIANGSAELDTAGWTAAGCTMARVSGTGTVPPAVGGWAFRLTAGTTTSSRMDSGPIAVSPGTTYRVGGQWWGANLTGTAGPGVGCIAIRNANGDTMLLTTRPASGARTEGIWKCPPGVTSITLSVYLAVSGASSDVRWDALFFGPVSGAHDTGYWDGDTPDTAVYRYDWTGTAKASTSTRTNITGTSRAVDTFTVYPGVTWWEYLEPLVQVAGLRLYCDEARRWHLVNPETWLIPGNIQLQSGQNMRAATDKVSRDTETWADVVVIHYRWTTSNEEPREAWDSSGTGTKVLVEERSTPYPGPGAAAAIAARMMRRGHELDVDAVADLLAAPSQSAAVLLPDSTELVTASSSVRWTFPDGDMAVGLRDPIEVPKSAWIKLAVGESWLESPVGESWLEEVVA